MAMIKYYGMLVNISKVEAEEFDCKKVSSLLKMFKAKYGNEFYKSAKMSYILINDVNASTLNGYNTKLSEGDIVKFLPVCGGG